MLTNLLPMYWLKYASWAVTTIFVKYSGGILQAGHPVVSSSLNWTTSGFIKQDAAQNNIMQRMALRAASKPFVQSAIRCRLAYSYKHGYMRCSRCGNNRNNCGTNESRIAPVRLITRVHCQRAQLVK